MKNFLVVCICLYLFIPVVAFAEDESDIAKGAKSAILIEASTGEVIYEKNEKNWVGK